MAGRKENLIAGTFTGAAALICFAQAQSQTARDGALYPPDVMDAPNGAQVAASVSKSDLPSANEQKVTHKQSPFAINETPLVKALGPAAFVLNDVGVSEAFRARIRRAVGRHPTYHAQISALDESRAERKRARSTLYPQLSTQLRGDYVIKRDFATDTDNIVESLRPREQFSAAISASQLVFDGGATFQRIKSARARHSEFQNAVSTRINDLSLSALAAYHDLLTHQALLAFGEAFIQRHEKILQDVKERERLGAGSRADVTRALARLAAARARVSQIRESKRLAEVRYVEFFDEVTEPLSRPPFSRLAVDNRDAAVQAALQRNPELAVIAARAEASRADYKVAKSARLPEVRVSVDAVKFDVFDSGDDFDVRAGVNLNYDIFGGGARAADIAEARARARQAKFGEDQIRREIARDAALAFERREGAQDRLRALETAVIAHDQTRELILERYLIARGDLIDVLQAENDYFEAGLAYLTGLANRDMAVYGLMEHTGDLLRFFSPQQEFAAIVNEGAHGE